MGIANASASGGGQLQRSGSKGPQGAGGGMLLELVDRILNKGIVIDVWARVSVLSIEALTIEARVVVASVETYQKWAEMMANTALASAPRQSNVVEAAPAPQQFAPQPQAQPLQYPAQGQALPQPAQQPLQYPAQPPLQYPAQQPAQAQPQPVPVQPQQPMQPPPAQAQPQQPQPQPPQQSPGGQS